MQIPRALVPPLRRVSFGVDAHLARRRVLRVLIGARRVPKGFGLRGAHKRGEMVLPVHVRKHRDTIWPRRKAHGLPREKQRVCARRLCHAASIHVRVLAHGA